MRLAADPAAAEHAARRILGMDIKGHTVGTVMLAEPVDIDREFYVSYVLDRAARSLPRDRLRRGRHGDEAGRGRGGPGPWRGSPSIRPRA
ncbi:hypothetical protein LV779_37545 [Streptomyces thinghirensis]|nr:hypothetical protein [Streptomyces thinghirensis]